MSGVTLAIEGGVPLRPHTLVAHERLGEAWCVDLVLRSALEHPVLPADVMHKGAEISFGLQDKTRTLAGVVTRFSVLLTDHATEFAYRMTVSSRFESLALRRMARTFSQKSAPDIIEIVVGAVGLGVRRHLLGSYPELAYVVQYQETDAAFVRRLCEEHGLWFRFEAAGAQEMFVLEDDSREAEPAITPTLTISSREARASAVPLGHSPRHVQRRRPGKVTVRDYNPDKPQAQLEASKTAGSEEEQRLDVYIAPAGFSDPNEGDARAEIALQARRGDADVLYLESNVFSLAPGDLVELTEDAAYHGLVRAEGAWIVLAQRSEWHQSDPDKNHASLELLPQAVRYRLPALTPRPHVAGVQSCLVAGSSGQEIDPDELGRVYLEFHWDVHSGNHKPRDNPPFRVMQPEAPGALVVPRVGWEVFVAFEDGDPHRPMVLGRSFNHKQPPPVPLPDNKTITQIATDSSPGAGARSVVQLEDRAGHEHMLWNAPFNMTTTIGNDRKVQVANNENETIGSGLSETIAASETNSIHLGWLCSYGSRAINVGAAQRISVGGNFVTNVGPEVVVVSGMVAEQVGSPVNGAANLAVSTALAGVAALPKVGPYLAVTARYLKAGIEGFGKGGAAGAVDAVKAGVRGMALSYVPGGDALTATVFGSGWAMPWDHGRPSPAWQAPGGGGSGASGGGAGPAGPGPGYRNQNVTGGYLELVCGAYGIATGAVSWGTLAGSTTLIEGSHNTNATNAKLLVGGAHVEKIGALTVDSKTIVSRNVLGAYNGNVGPLTVGAGGTYTLSASTVHLNVSGTLRLNGGIVTLGVGGSVISASSSGVTIKSGYITFTKKTQQGGSLTHK